MLMSINTMGRVPPGVDGGPPVAFGVVVDMVVSRKKPTVMTPTCDGSRKTRSFKRITSGRQSNEAKT